MTAKLERRFGFLRAARPREGYIRAETRAGGGRKLVGVAAAYDVIADIGPFRERITPGAFAGSLAEGTDILALLDHDPSRVLGRTRSKTLTLTDNEGGLFFELDVPDTSAGRDALALAERGDLGGASIGMFVEEEGRDGEVRIVKRAQLLEISIVSAWPAYAETSVEARRGFSFADRPCGIMSSASPTPRLDALRRYLETLGSR